MTALELKNSKATFERVAQLLGANIEHYPVSGAKVDADHFITISAINQKNIRLTLVRDAHTGNGLDNTRVAFLPINYGASDKVIMNRYNKLVSML